MYHSIQTGYPPPYTPWDFHIREVAKRADNHPSAQPNSCQTTQPNTRKVHDEYPKLWRHRYCQKNFVIGITGMAKTKTETNNPKGFEHAIEYLKKHQVDLVVMESTGGLEVPLAKALHHAGLRVVIANPRRTFLFSVVFTGGKPTIKTPKCWPITHKPSKSKAKLSKCFIAPFSRRRNTRSLGQTPQPAGRNAYCREKPFDADPTKRKNKA